MNKYLCASAIKTKREQKNLTQAELGKIIGVSDKTVSKWECEKGYPDILLLKPLAAALDCSVNELLSGKITQNNNISANLRRGNFYVCPICKNVIFSVGEADINCCGISLIKEEPEPADLSHTVTRENVEDEVYITVNHEMTKEHYISFIALVTGDGVQIIKLYPEGDAAARLKLRGKCDVYVFCNKHGLIKT